MYIISQKKKPRALLNKEVSHLENHFNNYYYKEVANLTGAGGWSVDFIKKETYLDPAAKEILEVPEDFILKPESLIQFYAEGKHQEAAVKYYMECSSGKAFTTTVKMRTYTGKEFWVKAIGKPTFNNKKEVIGIRGVFQDIDNEKLREIDLKKSLKVIQGQNEKLKNFAHIVSHNLRSHSSNLQLTLELLRLQPHDNDSKEDIELKDSLHQISKNLNTTISHLNEIITIQKKASQKLTKINIKETFLNAQQSLLPKIEATNADIFYDFSEVEKIDYIPAYLDSIMYNLLSNALKYKAEDREPSIQVYTYLKDDEPYLMFKDNGIGIDLDQYGDKLFNIYQTFHLNEDSVGLGLFMTKNQVEALGGKITVESEPNVGTTFYIKL